MLLGYSLRYSPCCIPKMLKTSDPQYSHIKIHDLRLCFQYIYIYIYICHLYHGFLQMFLKENTPAIPPAAENGIHGMDLAARFRSPKLRETFARSSVDCRTKNSSLPAVHQKMVITQQQQDGDLMGLNQHKYTQMVI